MNEEKLNKRRKIIRINSRLSQNWIVWIQKCLNSITHGLWQAGGKNVNEKLFTYSQNFPYSPTYHLFKCLSHSVASERYVVSMMFAMRPLRTHNFGVFSFFSLQSSRIPFYAFISKVRQIYRRCVCLRSDSECVGDGKFIVWMYSMWNDDQKHRC